MAKKKGKKSLANPALVEPYVEEEGFVHVIIETPKGSRNKYAFNEDLRLFELCKVLPSGMAFPYDYGFVPSTRAHDGDPVDVLLLTDEPTFPGCLSKATLIGAIRGESKEQKGGGETTENDRLIAVAEKSHLYGGLKNLDQLDASFAEELEKFFVNYHSLDDEKFRVTGKCNAADARRLLKKSRE